MAQAVKPGCACSAVKFPFFAMPSQAAAAADGEEAAAAQAAALQQRLALLSGKLNEVEEERRAELAPSIRAARDDVALLRRWGTDGGQAGGGWHAKCLPGTSGGCPPSLPCGSSCSSQHALDAVLRMHHCCTHVAAQPCSQLEAEGAKAAAARAEVSSIAAKLEAVRRKWLTHPLATAAVLHPV